MAVGAHRDGRSRNHSETPNRRLVMEQRYPSPSFANRWLRAVRTAPFNGGRSRSTTSQMRGPLILSYSCRKRFPMPRIRAQGRPGQRPSACGPSLLAASLIRSRQRSTASYVLGSSTKALPSTPAVERSIASLEGTNSLCLYTSLHPRLQRSFLYQFDWLSEQAGKPQLDAYQVEERQAPRFVKAGQ
jgi:hypothetical protein